MNDPILLFLTADVVALLVLGACAPAMSRAVRGIANTMLCGLGALLCLPSLLFRMPPASFEIPVGPPGLSLHLALDPLSIFFLTIVFLAATSIAAFQAAAASHTELAAKRTTPFCIGGTAFCLMSADGVALAVGLAVACASLWQPERGARRAGSPQVAISGPNSSSLASRNAFSVAMLVPVMTLVAVCLLTPAGYAPRFDAIRAAPIDLDHATAAVALTAVAGACLVSVRAWERCWTRDALVAGVLIPAGCYLLLRLAVDLPGAASQAWWGFVLVLGGGVAAVHQGWRSAAVPDIDAAVAALMRRQAGLAAATVGIALVARTADLADAVTLALEATCLTAIATSLGGTLTTLAAHTVGAGADTYRLSRLGGLIQTMPATSAALSAGLMALSALPPGLGFAALWLSFQSILSAPRTGGLLSQLPIALAAAAIALSASLSTVASVRMVGIALLGRPRSPRGAAAEEHKSLIRTILLVLGGFAFVAGVVPGPLLRALADPAIQALTGLASSRLAGLASPSASDTSSGYLALPVFVLLVLGSGAVILTRRRTGKEVKLLGAWMEGTQPPVGLPFGEPGAQSAGAGFLPALPRISWPHRPNLPTLPRLPASSAATAGLWLVLAAFGALLLTLAATS